MCFHMISGQIVFERKMVFWVFGYGSLAWNPGFEFDEKVIGFVKGYRRVFDLGMLLKLIPVSVCIFDLRFHCF